MTAGDSQGWSLQWRTSQHLEGALSRLLWLDCLLGETFAPFAHSRFVLAALQLSHAALVLANLRVGWPLPQGPAIPQVSAAHIGYFFDRATVEETPLNQDWQSRREHLLHNQC